MNDNRMRARNRWGKSGLRSQKLNAVLCINRLSQVFCFSKIRASKGEALALVLTNALLIDNKWLTFPRLKERGSIEAIRRPAQAAPKIAFPRLKERGSIEALL